MMDGNMFDDLFRALAVCILLPVAIGAFGLGALHRGGDLVMDDELHLTCPYCDHKRCNDGSRCNGPGMREEPANA